MTDQHPITPPQDLIDKWSRESFFANDPYLGYVRAAQWGADQELEACCELLDELPYDGPMLNAARRPKPPSLKEQALAELEEIMTELHDETGSAFTASAIRRALEALPE